MQAQPQKEHEWLHQLIGDWTYESDCSMGPGQPRFKFNGRESVRSLGGLWVIGEGEGAMPGGGTANMIITLGYDPQKGHFVGSWIGSMMTLMWNYQGSLDADRKVLKLNAMGPNFMDGGKTVKNFQDIITIIDKDYRTLTSRIEGEDGQYHEFMTAHYRRTKA